MGMSCGTSGAGLQFQVCSWWSQVLIIENPKPQSTQRTAAEGAEKNLAAWSLLATHAAVTRTRGAALRYRVGRLEFFLFFRLLHVLRLG